MPIKSNCEMTAKEVAEALGDITPSGVDKLTTSALKKLRRSPMLFLLYAESSNIRSNNVGTLCRDEYPSGSVSYFGE